MERYFYVKDYAFDPTNSKIIMLAGYYTDAGHNFFFPTIEISREEAIKKIKSGEMLFLEDGCYRKVFIKVIKTTEGEYLKVDHLNHSQDYLG